MLSIVKQSVKQKFDVNPTISYNFERKLQAGVAESADAADLKSAGAILVGSSPTLGTKIRYVPAKCITRKLALIPYQQ